MTATEAFAQHEMDPDGIEFLRMWCAPVVLATCPSVNVKQFTITNEGEIKNESVIDKNEIENVSEIKNVTEINKKYCI